MKRLLEVEAPESARLDSRCTALGCMALVIALVCGCAHDASRQPPLTAHLTRELVDRDAIEQLAILYAHYVRTKDVEGLVGLFTPDAHYEILPDMGTFDGHAELRGMFRASIEGGDPWPFLHNHVVQLTDGDTATGFITAEVRSGNNELRVGAISSYEDVYRRLGPGVWKFQSRILTLTPLQPASMQAESHPE